MAALVYGLAVAALAVPAATGVDLMTRPEEVCGVVDRGPTYVADVSVWQPGTRCRPFFEEEGGDRSFVVGAVSSSASLGVIAMWFAVTFLVSGVPRAYLTGMLLFLLVGGFLSLALWWIGFVVSAALLFLAAALGARYRKRATPLVALLPVGVGIAAGGIALLTGTHGAGIWTASLLITLVAARHGHGHSDPARSDVEQRRAAPLIR